MKKSVIKLNESQLRKIIAESVKRAINEHEDDWFDESDAAYIGRTSAYYNDDDSFVYTPDYWTYSTDPNDRDFAGEVYELNDEGKTVITFRTKREIKNIVGAFSLDEKTNSVDLKKSLHK